MFFQNPEHPLLVEVYDRMMYLNPKMYIEKLQFSVTANLSTYKHVFDHVGDFVSNLVMGDDREWGSV